MVEISAPTELDASFAQVLTQTKADFVSDGQVVAQHGMTTIDMTGWPGWPELPADGSAIETFVATEHGVQPTSDNQPFIDAFVPLAAWLNERIRNALAGAGVDLDGDAYLTASVTESATLEGLAHMDDDTFIPTDNVGVVAIIGQYIGPRVATAPVPHAPTRPMGQVVFDESTLESFGNDEYDHCASAADQLVIFPQFGQLHAGPAAEHVGAEYRQLLVFRGRAVSAD